MIAAVREISDIELYRIQSGRMSPILHYLAPEVFPVVNGRSADGMELVFNDSVSTDLDDYLGVRKQYLTIREEFDFRSHLRDLDYFLHWISESVWTKASRKDIDRKVWQIKYSSSIFQSLWQVWKKGDIAVMDDWINGWGGMARTFLFDMSPGDIVVAHDGDHKLLAIGLVTPEKVDYVGGTDEAITFSDSSFTGEHIRYIDWVFTREFTDSIDTRDWDHDGEEDGGLSTQFHASYLVGYYQFEELRWKLSSNHREEVLPALETVESKSAEYASRSVRFFALQTNDRQDGDDPIERYHFTLDTTAGEKLRDTDRAWVVFLDDDQFNATARVDSIESDERNGESAYVATMAEYEKIQPVSLDAVRDEVGGTTSFDNPITQIGSDTYLRIEMGGASSRYFWLDIHSADWYQVDGEWQDSPGPNWDRGAVERFYPVPKNEKQVFKQTSAGDEVCVYDSSAGHIVGQAYVAAGPHWVSISDDDPIMNDEETDFVLAGSETSVKGITLRWNKPMDGIGWNEVSELLELDSDTLARLENGSVPSVFS